MLNGLLQHTLHLTIRITHLTSQLAHLSHINLAKRQEDRNHDDDDHREHLVHGEEIEEGTEEHRQDTERIRDGLRQEVDHRVYIRLQSVEHVTRMKSFSPLPFRAKDAVEHFLLHTVLRLDAQEITNPNRGDIEGEVGKNQASHQAHSPIDVTLHGMGSHIDGSLHRPYLRQTHPHRQQAYGSIEHSLQLVALPCSPKPYQQGLDIILKLRYFKHISLFH